MVVWTLPSPLSPLPSSLPQDHRFSDEIDKLTGYKTQSILCMTICNSDGEVIGVVQAINKNPMGSHFTEDDEKVRIPSASWLLPWLCRLHMDFIGYLSFVSPVLLDLS